MNETLKAAGNLGAELGAARAENARMLSLMRRVMKTVCQVRDTQDLDTEHGMATDEALQAQIDQLDASLSQQAEPVCPFCGEPSDHCNQSFPHHSKQAPPQEEREMTAGRAANLMRRFKSEEKMLGPNEQAAIDYVLELLANRPAQTEQQPVCWASSSALAKLQNGRNNSPCVLTDGPAEFNDTPLYAAPIAQTAPQPQQSGLSGKCCVEVIGGREGPSLYIGDGTIGHRLAGNKPWGGGRTLHTFKVDISELVREAAALSAQRGDA